MPKYKNLRNELLKLLPSQLHHANMSGVLEEKFYATRQEWNENKLALGWSIDYIKGRTI